LERREFVTGLLGAAVSPVVVRRSLRLIAYITSNTDNVPDSMWAASFRKSLALADFGVPPNVRFAGPAPRFFS
jgi:hypothetical protein